MKPFSKDDIKNACIRVIAENKNIDKMVKSNPILILALTAFSVELTNELFKEEETIKED